MAPPTPHAPALLIVISTTTPIVIRWTSARRAAMDSAPVARARMVLVRTAPAPVAVVRMHSVLMVMVPIGPMARMTAPPKAAARARATNSTAHARAPSRARMARCRAGPVVVRMVLAATLAPMARAMVPAPVVVPAQMAALTCPESVPASAHPPAAPAPAHARTRRGSW